MNRRMTVEYLKTITFAIIASVIVSLLICYFAFFAGKSVDVNKPQYLINSIEQYIEISNGQVVIDEIALEGLRQYQSWVQIIDEEGKVVYSKYVPEEVPQEYSYFDLVNSVLESNRIAGYTLFINDLEYEQDYSVIIGCNSDVISNYSFQIEGRGNNLVIKCILVFLLTTIAIVIFAAYVFTKKVTIPITNVIEDIDSISKGQYVGQRREDNLFHNVFSQLQSLQMALDANEKTRAEWISNISHDIKTPLATVKGYAELMASDEYTFDDEEIKTYAKEILKSEEVMEGLVDDLKISQMLTEGKLKLNKEKTNLRQLIQECLEISKSCMKTEDAVNLKCDEDIFLFCDRKLMKRSLTNIICNAFIHNESFICVCISVEASEESISIMIEDDGKGLKEDEKSHIFERYYRGTNSSLTKGTGLGLAIAKEAILAHDGTIEVSNNNTKGTKFIITFRKRT